MNWFKHDTDASNDAKIKKLILRYSATGYAVYFHGLELIAAGINENNITFELEHDAEIIADNLKIKGTAEKSGREIVEEVMRYIIDLGLFEEAQGHIFCLKLLKRMDMSMTSSPKLRKTITDAKKHHDAVMIDHDKVMTHHARREEKRKEEKREDGRVKQSKSAIDPEVISILSALSSNSLRGMLKEWAESRKQLKKPLTAVALKRALGQLELWYQDNDVLKIEVVKKSIINGWTGLFPLKPGEIPKSESISLSDFMKLTPEEQERVRRERHAI